VRQGNFHIDVIGAQEIGHRSPSFARELAVGRIASRRRRSRRMAETDISSPFAQAVSGGTVLRGETPVRLETFPKFAPPDRGERLVAWAVSVASHGVRRQCRD